VLLRFTHCDKHSHGLTSKNRTSFRMALSQRLEFRQSQALVMTPQLMQAIKLLQLSSLDLAAYVENELERNPLLERASEDGDEPSSALDNAPADAEPEESGEWAGELSVENRESMEASL